MESMGRIAILTFQHSVVVRGIEKGLSELGYQIKTISEKQKLDNIDGFLTEADMFMMYLPDGIAADMMIMRSFANICDVLWNNGTGMVIIGEKNEFPDILAEIPKIKSFSWVDKPVDIEKLGKVIDSEFSRLKQAETLCPPDNVSGIKRILIVDDDPQYAKMVREWIKDIYPASVVTAGMQAITYLMKNNVDLILLDYEMPVVDGPQVFQMLKSEQATANIPVVFLTGVGDRESVQKVLSLHPTGYVLKSTTRDDLIKYIDSVFKKNS